VESLNHKLNEIQVRNENLERKSETTQSIIDQLKEQKIDIEYKSEKRLEEKSRKYEEELNLDKMLIEDLRMRAIIQNEFAGKLLNISINLSQV